MRAKEGTYCISCANELGAVYGNLRLLRGLLRGLLYRLSCCLFGPGHDRVLFAMPCEQYLTGMSAIHVRARGEGKARLRRREFG